MKQQVEGGQSAASAEVERLKEQLQQMTVTMETQQQRWAGGICKHHVCVCMLSPRAYRAAVGSICPCYRLVFMGNC